jgi:hypothetical protein
MKNSLTTPVLLLILGTLSELACPANPPPSNTPPVNPSSSPAVTVTFLGICTGVDYTNGAVFLLTNGGPTRVLYRVSSLEIRTSEGWVTNAVAAAGVRSSSGALPWWSCGGALKPFGTDVNTVVVPVTNAVWRLRFECIEQATGVLGAVHKTKDALTEVGTGVKTRTMGGTKYYVVTPEVAK